MQFSRATDYALLGLACLARQDQCLASTDQIAQSEQLSLTFLRKVFIQLARAGLIRSERGRGYRLIDSPAQISLRQVVEAVEGPLALNSCLSKSGCKKSGRCRLVAIWQRVQQKLLADLQEIRLDQII